MLDVGSYNILYYVYMYKCIIWFRDKSSHENFLIHNVITYIVFF